VEGRKRKGDLEWIFSYPLSSVCHKNKMYRIVELLSCTPETNITLSVNYTGIQKKNVGYKVVTGQLGRSGVQ